MSGNRPAGHPSSFSPAVSVIVPAWNAARYLRETLDSLLNQSFECWEAIIIDDGSTDSTDEIANLYVKKDPRFKLLRQRNSGPSNARAIGFTAASRGSRYLYFLDADDVLEKEALSSACEYLDHRENVSLVHFACSAINEYGNSIPDDAVDFTPMRHRRFAPFALWAREIKPSEPVTPFVAIYNLAGIIPSTAVMRRAAFEASGGWDVTFLQGYEDTDLWLRIALQGHVHFLPKRLVRYRRHSLQYTAAARDGKRSPDRYQKLIDKWRELEGLSDTQRKLVRDAEVFRRRGLKVYKNVEIARSALRHGKLFEALRHAYGAARVLLGVGVRPG